MENRVGIMGCISSVKWSISIFKCLKCGIERRYKHRETGPVRDALKRNYECQNCHSREFELING